MATLVTIQFEVENDKYNEYDGILDNFLEELNTIDIDEVDIQEVDKDKVANDKAVSENTGAYREVSIEIDSELFYDHVSDETKSWSFDLDDLKENKPVYKYVKQYNSGALKMLEDGELDYIRVYCDY